MRFKNYIQNILWSTNAYPSSVLPFIWIGRYVYRLVSDVLSGQITLRATSLVYTTLMALVPMIAVSFSLLKAMGVHTKQLEPMLLQFLEPMGEQGQKITGQIIGFIDKVNINVLGVVGVCFLLYSSISLIHKMEKSFNYVWRVGHSRKLSRRVTDYFTAILIGPSMMFFAVALSASALGTLAVNNASGYEIVEQGLSLARKSIPYFLIISAFTFLYAFIPNTKVKFKAALIAGVISGMCWQSAGWMFGTFVVSSKQSSTYAIYSGFAILILFMLWIYIGWIILLLGSSLAFYIQHPEHVKPFNEVKKLSPRRIRLAGIEVMLALARQFESGEKPLNAMTLAQNLNVHEDQLLPILSALLQQGFIHCLNEDFAEFVLAKSANNIKMVELIDALEKVGEYSVGLDTSAEDDWVKNDLQNAYTNMFHDLNLADVLERDNQLLS